MAFILGRYLAEKSTRSLRRWMTPYHKFLGPQFIFCISSRRDHMSRIMCQTDVISPQIPGFSIWVGTLLSIITGIAYHMWDLSSKKIPFGNHDFPFYYVRISQSIRLKITDFVSDESNQSNSGKSRQPLISIPTPLTPSVQPNLIALGVLASFSSIVLVLFYGTAMRPNEGSALSQDNPAQRWN